MFAAERGLERDRLCQKMIERSETSLRHLRVNSSAPSAINGSVCNSED